MNEVTISPTAAARPKSSPQPLSSLPFPYDWADPAMRRAAEEVAKAREVNKSMQQPVAVAGKPETALRKSARLGLSFPYDWSNPEMLDETLIYKVLERGIFNDITVVSHYFGIERIMKIYETLPHHAPSLKRMLKNITQGMNDAAA